MGRRPCATMNSLSIFTLSTLSFLCYLTLDRLGAGADDPPTHAGAGGTCLTLSHREPRHLPDCAHRIRRTVFCPTPDPLWHLTPTVGPVGLSWPAPARRSAACRFPTRAWHPIDGRQKAHQEGGLATVAEDTGGDLPHSRPLDGPRQLQHAIARQHRHFTPLPKSCQVCERSLHSILLIFRAPASLAQLDRLAVTAPDEDSIPGNDGAWPPFAIPVLRHVALSHNGAPQPSQLPY